MGLAGREEVLEGVAHSPLVLENAESALEPVRGDGSGVRSVMAARYGEGRLVPGEGMLLVDKCLPSDDPITADESADEDMMFTALAGVS